MKELEQALTVLRGCLEHPDAADAIAAIEAKLAAPAKPKCWAFAMEFLGDPEAAEIDAYVVKLEALAAPAQELHSWTDEELTAIYNRANNIDPTRHTPITTERIFAAMRAMGKSLPVQEPAKQDQTLNAPVEYQYRTKAAWDTAWSSWRKCSESAAEQCVKPGFDKNSIFEVRKLYTQPIPAGMVMVMVDLLKVTLAMREWIDAVPKDLQLPTMPGFDRDWADEVVRKAMLQAAKDSK